jgi:glycosyltransferase involved in cell wall biosynthesis
MGRGAPRFKAQHFRGFAVTGTIAIVTPAYRARRWIGSCVRSVLAQTYGDFEHWIISDDAVDYEALLAAEDLRDPRLHFASTSAVGAGAPRARNVALDALTTPYVAMLDADDRFKPDKLRRVIKALETIPLVSTAIDDVDESGRHLRYIGDGPDRLLSPAEHKFVNFSMDCMIAWDRRLTDGRVDPSIPNMTDIELLLQLYRTVPRSFHIGTPLHDYVKLARSMSNGPGVTERMIAAKRLLLQRLDEGYYPMADASGPAGIARFLEISIAAEASYPAALAERPGLLFEDHIEPLLRAASTSDA